MKLKDFTVSILASIAKQTIINMAAVTLMLTILGIFSYLFGYGKKDEKGKINCSWLEK